MSGHIDFSLPTAFFFAFGIAFFQPLYLLVATRLPGMEGRNAMQFLLSAAITVGLWALALAIIPAARPSGGAEVLVCVMILGGAIILALQAWGLLTTGYTLAVLLTLLKADRPLSEDEISQQYRGGAGLQWVMRRRLASLTNAGLVTRDDDRLTVSTFRGPLVAYVYWASIIILGLKRTG